LQRWQNVLRLRRALWFITFLIVCTFAAGARAQGIESILAPGKLVQGHAKWENDCSQCHVKFDRKAQDGLCMSCHKEVAADMRARTGYHGRLKPQACNTCHTDHKGRGAQIVLLDKKQFDHNQTDYVLRNKHQKVECDKCHVAGKKYREAPQECNACHRKDDVHKGSLGSKCADCHSDASWKETARFDHEKTRFSLTGKHVDVKCSGCHKTSDYKDTPRTCIGCHRKDDDQKGHKGQFGEKCESCHGTKAWKPSTFNHDVDTKYVLRGKHRTASCTDCHKGNLYRVKLSADCYACHKADDKHKESLGRDCGSCHSERSWKEPAKFNHDQTSFPLLGKHVQADCKDCHKSAMFKEAPKDCYSCHKKDDKHEGTLDKGCADCHTERDWKTTTGRFNHDLTKFRLRNAHADSKLKCSGCHADLKSYRKTPIDCYACHKKDDKHEDQQGKQCEQCHSDRSWRIDKFDHNLSRFPLTGRHIAVVCKDCHKSTLFKEAPRDCYACHTKDDKHKLKFGERCGACHNTRAWPIWEFDHDKRTKYRLDGAHKKAKCESCHKQEAPKGKDSAPVGTSCIACHRTDDAHDGQFGMRCETCHSVEGWKKIRARIGGSNQQLPELVAASMPFLGQSSHFMRQAREPAVIKLGERGTP
jgi:hypothetical protein